MPDKVYLDHPCQDSMPKGASEEGIDLIKQLLVFNPNKRPSSEACLKHQYVSRFNSKKDSKDLDLGYCVIPPINDDIQLTVDEYRQRLYQMIKVSTSV
jgi:mitogen-activated protein kinase 15